jgi:DNA-binding winged helix-turn-helix (wHTH) protein
MDAPLTEPVSESLSCAGRYALDPFRNLLTIDGREVQLTPLAARVMESLLRRPGEVVERTALIDLLWRGDWISGNPALNRVISEIRSAVSDDPRSPNIIQTVPRKGYRLVLAGQEGPAQSQPAEAPPARAPPARWGWGSPLTWLSVALVIVLLIVAGILATDWIISVMWVGSHGG